MGLNSGEIFQNVYLWCTVLNEAWVLEMRACLRTFNYFAAIMEVASNTTGREAAKMLHSGSKLLPTPSRTAMAISILANFGSSFTYVPHCAIRLLSMCCKM